MTDAPDSLAAVPPSAKLVYYVLGKEGPMTQRALIRETYLPERTVRSALSRLTDAGVVEEEFYVVDARQSLYSVSTDIQARAT